MARSQAQPIEKRKRPRQERSRAMVDAILEGAAQVLVERGLDALTTNRVAERAGLSIGSLYQYFPNKESIVYALLERHLKEARALRPPELDPGGELTLERRIRFAVDWHLRAHATQPALHQVLTEAAPRIIGRQAARDFERFHHAAIRDALRPYADALRPRDLETAAFVVATALEALTHGAVVHHPELLERSDFTEEVAELLLGYLTGG